MLKIGIVGLGNIAQKAYLPVYSQTKNVEFHLYTPNQEKLLEVGGQYRFLHLHTSLDSLINAGINGVFVHSSTVTHEEIIDKLLKNNIHVFVDKPITNDYMSTKRLVELAEERNLILMAGFNRRYTPAYNQLKEISDSNMIIVQKNRISNPKEIRNVVFDDFIHVVDTMRYLFPYPIEDLKVSITKNNNLLSHIVVQFTSDKGTAIGIMNRESGTNLEMAEVMSPLEKRSAYNLSKVVISKGFEETEIRFGDWETTLSKRGFEQMVADFIASIRNHTSPKISATEALESHRICELILNKVEDD
ncbi:Gfo/Idh/MocA family protein [Neobacillus terrae]|uniref:Gfo/Idh/MocA family protein n=1 Tax=Neobacillus terrae TaxID=3034837 RepID=UPI00140742E4|nr:Gfo/Idh/MocA family oxidoreductase [Neobacillus terrae]NHM30039.1 Gfo/Idh/MocA family oxidoreductase [Neobacillus terrae]